MVRRLTHRIGWRVGYTRLGRISHYEVAEYMTDLLGSGSGWNDAAMNCTKVTLLVQTTGH